MADLTYDEIQYENARLTREQWAAEKEGKTIPTELPADEITAAELPSDEITAAE